MPCALALILCGALAACGDLPRPFQPAEKSTQAWSAPGDIAWGSVLVPPIAGLSSARSAALVDAVVEALQVREVPASASTGGRGSIVLAGQVSAVTGKLRWTLVTPDGEAALRFEEPHRSMRRGSTRTAPDLAAIADAGRAADRGGTGAPDYRGRTSRGLRLPVVLEDGSRARLATAVSRSPAPCGIPLPASALRSPTTRNDDSHLILQAGSR